jgi:AmmeMemoRadiSam system protein B
MNAGVALGPAVAGTWYPAARDELEKQVDSLLGGADARSSAAILPAAALIVPHAGFAYSGAVAASAFARLRGATFDRVVVLGPSHYFGFRGAAIPDEGSVYRTPLGDVVIDGAGIAALRESGGFLADDRMFEPEHSIEAELPFLQRVLGRDVPILPVLLGGRASGEDAARVAEILAPLVTASTLVIVSSDFTHFGRRFGYTPFTGDVPARIRALDLGAIGTIEAGDASAFAHYVDATGATICGHRAIEVLLRLPGRASGAKLLEYDTSGRMTASWDHSVSYAAIAFAADGRSAS